MLELRYLFVGCGCGGGLGRQFLCDGGAGVGRDPFVALLLRLVEGSHALFPIALVEASAQGQRRKEAEARGRQLKRQRQPVQPSANPGDLDGIGDRQGERAA